MSKSKDGLELLTPIIVRPRAWPSLRLVVVNGYSCADCVLGTIPCWNFEDPYAKPEGTCKAGAYHYELAEDWYASEPKTGKENLTDIRSDLESEGCGMFFVHQNRERDRKRNR